MVSSAEFRVANLHDETLALIDPEPFSRDCLAEVLQSEFPKALIAPVASVAELNPPAIPPIAVILLKIAGQQAPRALGQTMRAIEQHIPMKPIVVMGAGDNGSLAEEAIRLGARGFFSHAEPLKIVIAALRLVMAGGTYYPFRSKARIPAAEKPILARPARVLQREEHDEPRETVDDAATAELGIRFTVREAEVLAALQRGRSNKWIASELNLSENTVKVHIRHIMRKLKASNRTQAVILSTSRMSFPQATG